MLDRKFKNLVETLIQTDIFGLDTIVELNLSLKEQKAKLKSMTMQLKEAENSFNRDFSGEMGTANDPEGLIQSGISSLLETLQVIVLFAKPNKTGDPMIQTKYRENITIQLKEAHEKSLNALSRLHLYNEIPTHEKAAEYIHNIFQDSTRLVTDILEEPNREKQRERYKQYEKKAEDNPLTSFLAITAPNIYRTAITNTLTEANSTLESRDLQKLIEDTIEGETAKTEKVVQILGEHAERHGKKGSTTKELGINVVKSITQIEALTRTTVVQHIAALIRVNPRFSVEPVNRKQKSENKSEWLLNFIKKKIVQFKEVIFTTKKPISPHEKLAKKENLFYIELKKQLLYEEPTKTTSEGKNILKEEIIPSLTAPERNPLIEETTITAPKNGGVSENQETSFSSTLKREASTQSTNNFVQQKKDTETQTENKKDASTQTENKKDASTQTESKKDASTQTESKKDASTQTESKKDASTQTENKKDASTQPRSDIVACSIRKAAETLQHQK
ncbi:hypothetical protein [Neorickettsia findlayensis]|uniref:hypothetical protein n=1 Tax=Neorickettsia findlayensis TaxID=2686014 RepID=UPI00162ADCF5|nr:hypothetical protein [Neorickettsia findlayensis]